MADSTIKVSDNGPYVITGSYEVVDAEGNTFKTKKAVSLCRYGHSSNKPFCDGTHKEIDFDSTPRADEQ